MKNFARLFYELDQTNKTNEKVDILIDYFRSASDEDIYWMLSLFTGRRPKRVVNSSLIRKWTAKHAGIPDWLFEECYSIAGDLSETVAMLLPPPSRQSDFTLGYWLRFMRSLEKRSEEERRESLIDAWDQLNSQERFVFNKLTSSTFRVGVSQNLVIRALSIFTSLPGNLIAHRLMGKWDDSIPSMEKLLRPEEASADVSQPYPFALAHPLEEDPQNLGEPEEWQAEWKWDGIRSQLIVRSGQIFIWSRGEDLVTDKFPELQALKTAIPGGTVIDGEILPYLDGKPASFNVLQTRIGRKNLTPKILREAPVVIYAYDLLEWNGEDIREKPLQERRKMLEELVETINIKPTLQLSPVVSFDSWEDLSRQRLNARSFHSEGIMLKRIHSIYQVGRKKGEWWKWKLDPFSVDAVMVYAQRGTGKRANLYTDYTFAVWSGKELITFAKAYSGLTDKEILEVDRWIKQNALEKFGPVITVRPQLVFEIGFEGMQRSARHKSGVALRFPRILRWRQDKPMEEADSISTLHNLLEMYEKGSSG